MATYGFDDLKMEIDNAVGGSLADVSAYVTEVSAFGVEAVLEDSHTAGDSWVEKLFVGLKQASEFSITGFYDDTATTGPDALLVNVGEVLSFKFTWGGSKTSAFECLLAKYERAPGRGELTKYSATLVPSGAVIEA
jgi:hypothetical protein